MTTATTPREYTSAVAGWMWDHWIDKRDCHATWWQSRGMAFCKKQPIAQWLIERHLSNPKPYSPVGAYYIDAEQTVKHICIDLDAHKPGETAEEPLRKLQHLLRHSGLDYVLARSKSGNGYHLRLHFDHPISSTAGRNLGLELLKGSGIPMTTEVFPKQHNLKEGSFGTMVWLPGSAHFRALSNGRGSVLIDKETLEPLPYESWLEVLQNTQAVPESRLRELSRSSGVDLWADPAALYRPRDAQQEYVCDELPEFTNIQILIGFLQQHGILIDRIKSGAGEWTDRILLKRCPNAEAHGSPREDGTAVLYDARSGRVALKCWHEGCSKFSWPKLLKGLGYRFRRAAPEPLQDMPHWHHLPEEVRLEWRRSAEQTSVLPVRKLILKAARCCEGFFREHCVPQDGSPGHGERGVKPIRCNNQKLCPNCLRVFWRKHHRPNIEQTWPDSAWVIEIPLESPEQGRSEIKRVNKIFAKYIGAKPRWFLAWDKVVLFHDAKTSTVVEGLLPGGKLLTKDQLLPLLEEAWLSWSNNIIQASDATPIHTVLENNAWFMRLGMKRTSAGALARITFPWLSTDQCRAQAKQAREERCKGLAPGKCDKVIGTNSDGTPIYCGKTLRIALVHRRTGKEVAVKFGAFEGDEGNSRFVEEDRNYFCQHLEE